MNELNGVLDLELTFWDCRGIRSEADVADVVRLIAEHGVVPGRGPWTPTATPRPVPLDELAAFLPSVHHDLRAGQPSGKKVSRLTPVEEWGFAALRPEAPRMQLTVSIGRLGRDNWEVGIMVSGWSHERAGVPLDAFASSWTDQLERIGAAVYRRAGPVLGALVATPSGDDETGDLSARVARRRLVVGWRTWFGPDYVGAYGADLLLGLPDRARPLASAGGAGVLHELRAPAPDLIRGAPAVYDRVLDYLEAKGIDPAWPEA